jgi:DNA-binding transcriptional MerR regulator
MNSRSLLLVATLGTNGALVALLLRSPTTPAATGPAEVRPAIQFSPKAKAAGARAKGQPEPAAAPEPAPAPPSFNWASIESADFKQYIKNLRDLGVPDATIRDLIRAEVTKLYRPKMQAAQSPANPEKYWERNYGPYSGQTTAQRPFTRAFPDVSPELLKQITALQTSMGEKQRALMDKTGGYLDSSSMADRQKVENEFYAELAKLVPAEQVEAYKLRSSNLSSNLRDELRAFQPTEEEFKAIFRQREVSDSARTLSPDGVFRMDAAGRERMAQATAELDKALGPERAKEYKALSGYEVRNLAEAGVPRESLLRLAEMKTSAEAAAANLRKDTALSAEQRTAALQAIRAETEKELATLLGERRAKAYPNSSGYWLQNLAPNLPTRVVTP